MSSDHLSNEVSLNARLEGKGVAVGARSRAIAAFDRLLGALLDIPIASLEGRAQRKRLRFEKEFQETSGTPIDVSASPAEDAVTIAIEQHIEGQATRNLENKKVVVERAIEHLQDEPVQQHEPDTSERLDEDWLNYFESYAEKANSERMRDLWGRVLAGKIRAPGKYSLTTLRFLSELDTSIAQLFEKHVRLHFMGQFIFKPKTLKGQDLIDLTFLEEVGLLQEVNGPMGLPVSTQSPDQPWTYDFGSLVLLVHLRGIHRLELIRITRTGQELLSLMAPSSEMEYIENVASEFMESASKIAVGHIHSRQNGRLFYNIIRVLKEEANIDGTSTDQQG